MCRNLMFTKSAVFPLLHFHVLGKLKTLTIRPLRQTCYDGLDVVGDALQLFDLGQRVRQHDNHVSTG